MAETFRCPTCSKLVRPSTTEFPFCCERCRLVDLGRWFSEDYKVSRSLHSFRDVEDELPPELLEALEELGEEWEGKPQENNE